MTLFKRLSIAFILTIIISIIIVSLISHNMINNRFDDYLLEEQEERFRQIHSEINALFIEKGNYITTYDLISFARSENLYLEILDINDGSVIKVDALGGNHGMGMHHMEPGRGRHMIPEGEYVENSMNLLHNDTVIGKLTIGYMDTSYLSESSLVFKDTLTKSLIISSLVAIIIGFIISIFLTKGITTPLIRITNTANKIKEGKLNSRSSVNENILEIQNLSQTINFLGETLEEQEDLRKQYATDISHELRTPLTTLKTHVEGMKDKVIEVNDSTLGILEDEINRLTTLVEDLKNTFKSNEGLLNLNKEEFNLTNDMRDLVSTFIPLFDRENYSLISNIEDNIIVTMDRDRIKQIIYNLLSNAIKYLNPKGSVNIHLYKESDKIIIKVNDNGIGMTKEELNNIFERFYRVKSEKNTEIKGTGLGLSITKALVEAHGGDISVKSEKGKGSSFIVRLPLV